MDIAPQLLVSFEGEDQSESRNIYLIREEDSTVETAVVQLIELDQSLG